MPVIEKMRNNGLAWYGYVLRREEGHVTRMLEMNVDIEVEVGHKK